MGKRILAQVVYIGGIRRRGVFRRRVVSMKWRVPVDQIGKPFWKKAGTLPPTFTTIETKVTLHIDD